MSLHSRELDSMTPKISRKDAKTLLAAPVFVFSSQELFGLKPISKLPYLNKE